MAAIIILKKEPADAFLFYFKLFPAHLCSSCLRDSNRIPIGIKHLDSILRLLTSDNDHIEIGQGGYGIKHRTEKRNTTLSIMWIRASETNTL